MRMSFRPGVPGSIFATSVVQPVRQPPMMVQVAPVRHVTVLPANSVGVVMRPVVNPSIHTIAAPPRPQIVRTFSATHAIISNSVAVQQQAAARMNAKVEAAAGANAAAIPSGTTNPAVTVFVSNITERASDTLVRQILMKCGTVYAWKRVQGASGKLQAFGFCEYKDVESALRAIYLLHDFKLGDKKLLVKVDAKTQEIINKWKENNGIKTPEDGSEAPPPNVDESKAGLDLLMKEYAAELNTSVSTHNEPEPTPAAPVQRMEEPMVRESHNVEENLKDLDLEDSEKDFISKEIRSFRAAQKQKEEEKKKDDEKRKRLEKEKEKRDDDRDRERSRHREKERDERERSRKKDRSRTPQRRREPSRTRHSRSPVTRIRRSRTPVRSSRPRTPPRRRSRSRSNHRSSSRIRRSRSRSPRRRDDDDEDDESYERRRLERKIREKEQAYQERLRVWEVRERRRKREYEKRDERDLILRKEMLREAKRLQEFLADYDDLKMDPKYYTGGAMMKRRREWERENDADNKDRKKEQEEIDALRQKLVEENHPDPEAAIAKALKETENVWQPLLKPDTPPPVKRESSVKKRTSSSSSSSSGSDSESERDEKSGSNSSESEAESEEKSSNGPRLVSANLVPVVDEPATSFKKGTFNTFEAISHNGNDTPENSGEIKMEYDEQSLSPTAYPIAQNIPKTEPVMQLPGGNQRKKLKVSDVFNQDDDEEEVPRKRKLVPLEYTHEEKNAVHPVRTSEDKRKLVRALIDKIPTKKEDLFDFNLDWSQVDANLMDKRIQPWITKKIVEYIGEEEPTLVEFICSKIMSKSPPERIYEDVSMVLDDEAEVFVVKMWRLLIYETEAKKEGLTK
uniref:RNA-binding protein 25-like n=1 Tax=Styela clava TaxID=7725 RepID=UPI001939E73E|nr:RNA-binding protein 25-like [Styela clava]